MIQRIKNRELTTLSNAFKKVVKAYTLFSLIGFCSLALSEHLPVEESQSASKLAPTEPLPTGFSALHQCEKSFEYDVHFLKGKVGYLHRTIKWDNNAAQPKAVVTSNGEVSFLWLDSTYQQTSSMQYSAQNKHFLTSGFSQKLTGLKNRVMLTEISNDGHSSTVTLDDELVNYQQQVESKNLPLYDIDTLGAQIRLNLLQEKKHFKLSRQASSRIDTYHFEVAGMEVIDHKKWGKLATIKVIEVDEHDSVVLWFSKKHDFQLVKAELDMIFSPTVWLTHFSMQCP